MQRRLITRTLNAASLYSHQRQISVPTRPLYAESIDDFVQKQLQKEPSKLPLRMQGVIEMARRKLSRKKDFIDPEFKALLDKAASQLYYDCANKYPYLELCKAFDLPDYMSTWFKLTLMHVWMVLIRMHVSLDAGAYDRVKRGLLSTMWLDVDKRLEIVGEEINQKLNTAADMRKMNGLYLQTLLEYDEGFLSDDRALAAAVWRNLYMTRSFDPIYVNTVVRYMRASVSYLDSIEVNDLLVNGIEHWKPAESLRAAK
uniref:Ubiq_cyt_C_chap domain-containing protein n=1 Tax=Panagrellus redivivus TaxID=6233 RepID=A0A7E4V991_PANRE